MSKPNLMVLSQDINELTFLQNSLDGFDLDVFSDIDEAVCFFKSNASFVRLLILSCNLKNSTFLDVIDVFNKINSDLKIIIISQTCDSESVLKALKKGVYDFIDINISYDDLNLKINTTLSDKITRQSKYSSFKNENFPYYNLTQLLDQLLCDDEDVFDYCSAVSNIYKSWKKSMFDGFDKPSILIVEDEPDYNDMFYDFLSNDFKVYSVFDGESCKEILETERFDIVLLDLFLPDISGSELVQCFLEKNAETQIVVITAFDITSEVIDVMRAGASNLLQKPVLKADLIGAINEAWTDIIYQRVLLTAEATFFSVSLTDDQKDILLKMLFDYYEKKNERLKMFEIYMFYPELKKINVPDLFEIPKHVTQENISHFIHSIRSVNVVL